MRDDQYAKLNALNEKLADVVLREADPENWNGKEGDISALTRDQRGDRYWCKKNASATLSVMMRIYSLTGMIERASTGAPADPVVDGETDLDKEVKSAEREARAILRNLASKSRARSN